MAAPFVNWDSCLERGVCRALNTFRLRRVSIASESRVELVHRCQPLRCSHSVPSFISARAGPTNVPTGSVTWPDVSSKALNRRSQFRSSIHDGIVVVCVCL